jgi:hypothetical protein
VTDTRARDALAAALHASVGHRDQHPDFRGCSDCIPRIDAILAHPFTPDQRRALAAAFHPEARAALLAELEAGVEGLWTHTRRNGFATPGLWVDRATVLDLIRKAGERP